jgi:5-methylcytosine-specific restriction endonuclease McrA
MASSAPTTSLQTAELGRHWLDRLPYCALVAVNIHPNGTALYQVAGSAAAPCGAFKALQSSLKIHGGKCFYCDTANADEVGDRSLTIDHIEPQCVGGNNHLANLVIACRKCNIEKGAQRIEAYNPEAGKAWLEALLIQVQNRLNRV